MPGTNFFTHRGKNESVACTRDLISTLMDKYSVYDKNAIDWQMGFQNTQIYFDNTRYDTRIVP